MIEWKERSFDDNESLLLKNPNAKTGLCEVLLYLHMLIAMQIEESLGSRARDLLLSPRVSVTHLLTLVKTEASLRRPNSGQ